MSEAQVEVMTRENGPILITGPVTLKDHLGNTYNLGEKEKFALCRCTKSEKMPFCDGTHKTCGFEAQHLAPPEA